MTTIAYRDGALATDSGVWQGNIIAGTRTKVFRLEDGSLFAGCGASADRDECLEWLKKGALASGRPEKSEGEQRFGGLLVRRDGRVINIDHKFRLTPAPNAVWHVCGAAEEFLHGAMAAGASAEEAVTLAIAHTDGAVGPVQVIYL